ncbi:MAG: YlzJ-like family protein [Moorellales bacterium]
MYPWLENTAPCVLYSLFPSETLLIGWDQVGPTVEISVGPDVLQLRADADGYRLERIITCNPSLYLHPGLTPGRKIPSS